MKTKRHSKILELIKNKEITTQEELLKHLKGQGFDVTQATISRDIKELRLVKILGKDGQYRYSVSPAGEIDYASKFSSIFSQSVIAVDRADSMVVLKCFVGMAQAACAAIDAMHFDGLIGTIAGDDTIFAQCRSSEQAAAMVEKVSKMIGGKN